MGKRAGFFILASLWSGAIQAADVPIANPQLQGSARGVRDAAHARDLRLRRFDMRVELRGAVSQTTVDAVFSNPTDEALEGDFRLRLPAGAVVTGYALDIGSQMVDGVLVDRPRAKAVYDARVRRGVDPGLAEVTAGNVFETHVNPIFPHQGRHIRVRFTVPVGLDGLHLPLNLTAPVDGWSVTVHALGSTSPVVTGPSGKNFVFVKSPDGATGTLSGAADLAGDFIIARPASPDVLVSDHRTGERDVQLSGTLAVPSSASATARLRIYWSRARSRQDTDIAGEIDLVRQLIDRMHPNTIELVTFNSTGADRKIVSSADAAVAWLKSVRYRGATSYAPLVGDGAADRCVLFSAGPPTIDRATPFAPSCQLDVVSSASGSDFAWLRHVAAARGGDGFAFSAKDSSHIVDALVRTRAGVVAALDQDGKPLSFVSLDAPAGRWLALVRAPEAGPITVRLADATGTRETVIRADGPSASFDGLGTLIATDRLASLGTTEEREDYVALSRKYGIASPSLSFLVLETPADYLAAKVAPPANYPADARDVYLRQAKALQADQAQQGQRWLDQVASEWKDTVAWWQTKFDPSARPKRVTTSSNFDQTTPSGTAPVMRPDMAPPPPPPPPPPAPVAALNNESNDEVVTARRAEPTHASRGQIAAGKAAVDGTPSDTIAIEIAPWQPDRPYLELFDGKPEDFDSRFLEAQTRHGGLPIFYLDTAEWLRKHGRAADASEMVLSALELPTANDVTLGIVADRLERYGQIDRAIELRERQTALDPDRPQPRRLLALALARRATVEPARAKADLTRAIEILYGIAITPQDGPWRGIEMIALDEANRLLPRLRRLGGNVEMDARLVKLLDVDMRVVIDWTTDGSDMDLWIDEPDRERAIYNNPRTAIGGHLSHDMTQGYGPEEYMLHTAPPGTYTAQANVYAPDRLDPNGATLVTAHIFRDYGRPSEHEESVDIEVKRDDQGSKMIGRIVIAPKVHGD